MPVKSHIMEPQQGSLNPRTIRTIVAVTSTLCVAGMIVAAALKHLGGVITLGCLSSAAIMTLIAVVATQQPLRRGDAWSSSVNTESALRVETLVSRTVDEGAEESTVRELVGAAVELGRTSTRSI